MPVVRIVFKISLQSNINQLIDGMIEIDCSLSTAVGRMVVDIEEKSVYVQYRNTKKKDGLCLIYRYTNLTPDVLNLITQPGISLGKSLSLVRKDFKFDVVSQFPNQLSNVPNHSSAPPQKTSTRQKPNPPLPNGPTNASSTIPAHTPIKMEVEVPSGVSVEHNNSRAVVKSEKNVSKKPRNRARRPQEVNTSNDAATPNGAQTVQSEQRENISSNMQPNYNSQQSRRRRTGGSSGIRSVDGNFDGNDERDDDNDNIGRGNGGRGRSSRGGIHGRDGGGGGGGEGGRGDGNEGRAPNFTREWIKSIQNATVQYNMNWLLLLAEAMSDQELINPFGSPNLPPPRVPQESPQHTASASPEDRQQPSAQFSNQFAVLETDSENEDLDEDAMVLSNNRGAHEATLVFNNVRIRLNAEREFPEEVSSEVISSRRRSVHQTSLNRSPLAPVRDQNRYLKMKIVIGLAEAFRNEAARYEREDNWSDAVMRWEIAINTLNVLARSTTSLWHLYLDNSTDGNVGDGHSFAGLKEVLDCESLVHDDTESHRLRSIDKLQRQIEALERKLRPKWNDRDRVKARMGSNWFDNAAPKRDFAALREEDERILRECKKALEKLLALNLMAVN